MTTQGKMLILWIKAQERDLWSKIKEAKVHMEISTSKRRKVYF